MTWVVTGATGTIGRAVVGELVAAGERVVAIARTASRMFAPPVVACDLDLADPNVALPAVGEDVTLVALAARITATRAPADLAPLAALDIKAHLRLVAHLRPRHVIYASSCTVYGYVTAPSRETDPIAPLHLYALAKAAGERLLAQASPGMTALRIAQVYGPGAPDEGALYGLLRSAARGEPVRVRAARTVRDFCHASDVARAILLAAQARARGTFNIGGGARTELAEVARTCLACAGRTDPPVVEGEGGADSMWLDITAARAALGYAPAVSLADGLAREYRRLHG